LGSVLGVRRPAVLVIVTMLLAVAACSGDGSGSEGEAGTTTSTRPGACRGAAEVRPGTERITIRAGGIERDVERVVPRGYDGTTPAPLVLSLHGFTSTIEQQDLFSDLPEEAAARGYLLLTPQAAPATLTIGGEKIRAPYWNLDRDDSTEVPGAQDDVAFLTKLIATARDELCVDDARVYVTGNSNGAGMTARLACALRGRLAGIAPVSGINLAPHCDDPTPVSVIAFHGDADPLVPYEGGTAANVETGDPAVEARVREFARAAGCRTEPEQSSPFADIELRRFPDCRAGTAVELYTVRGGGHTWPGMLNYVDVAQLSKIAGDQRLTELADVDLAAVAGHMTTNLEATTAMLDFFDAHRRP
jgi:polyhydroxybutyrate depolymerase